MRSILTALSPAALRTLVVLSVAAFAANAWASIIVTCSRFGTVTINNEEYVYQQNEWNSTATQCASADNVTGAWTITQASFNLPTNGPPASYPSSFRGCHWGNCTHASGFPVQVSGLGSTPSTWSTTQPASGAYNVAYDLWFHQTPTAFGQPDGAELMIWLNGRGVQPAGSMIANTTIAGENWDVWTFQMPGWKYIVYRHTTGLMSVSNLNLKLFVDDAVARGSILPAWWLIDIEAGFEIWQGGQGLATTAFSVSTASPFTDDPLIPGSTPVRAVHIVQLRTLIDAVRHRYFQQPFDYTNDSIGAGGVVKAVDITEMRTALAGAYTGAGRTPPSYSTAPAPGASVRAADIAELRSALLAIP